MTAPFDPAWLWPLIAAPFVGSFLGVVARRLPEGLPLALARSACPHCAHRLGLRDLVPIASWLAQRGRCRYCGAALGPFYPAIELAAVAAVAWAALAVPPALMGPAVLLGWWLIALAAADARSLVLPDALTLPLIVAGLAVTYAIAPEAILHHALGAVAGFAVLALVALAYRRLRGREGIGLGDAKLAAAAGAWVSWTGLPGVLLIAAVLGLTAALLARAAGRRLTATTEVPFGPWLCLATWIVWVHGPLALG